MMTYRIYSALEPVPISALVGMQLSFLSYALSEVFVSDDVFRAMRPWAL